jgi:hypothetical protein
MAAKNKKPSKTSSVNEIKDLLAKAIFEHQDLDCLFGKFWLRNMMVGDDDTEYLGQHVLKDVAHTRKLIVPRNCFDRVSNDLTYEHDIYRFEMIKGQLHTISLVQSAAILAPYGIEMGFDLDWGRFIFKLSDKILPIVKPAVTKDALDLILEDM